MSDLIDLRTVTGRFGGRRQVAIASGADTVSFLQGQLSQDIEAMAPGDTAWSLLLQPQGRIDAWLRVTRRDSAEYALDVDAGALDAMVARLERFKLRTDCTIEAPAWTCLTIVGPAADEASVVGAELDLLSNMGGVPVRDVFGAAPTADAVAEVPDAAFEALRIEAGVPAMGREIDDSTIPASTGVVERSVSFTKGCYTGQELVARMDSRGNNAPFRLVGLRLDGAAEAGSALTVDGREVGTLTSVAESPQLGLIGLGYLARAVETGTRVEVEGASAALTATLPIGST